MTVGRKQKKKAEGEADAPAEPAKQSKSVKSKIAKRQEGRTLDSNLNSQFDTGRLLAAISSRPGQCGPLRRLHPGGQGAGVLCQAHGEEEEVDSSLRCAAGLNQLLIGRTLVQCVSDVQFMIAKKQKRQFLANYAERHGILANGNPI